MQKFELVLKNEKEKSYRIISWIIIIINIIAFIALSAVTDFQKSRMLYYAGLTLIFLFTSRYFKNKAEQFGFVSPFLFIILGWVNTKFWWVAFIVLLFLVLDIITRRQLIVYVNADRISYPSWPKKEIEWSELSNMVIKDRLLTIDFKNNKLIQHEIINDANDYDVNEKEFNEFCIQQLHNAEAYKYN